MFQKAVCFVTHFIANMSRQYSVNYSLKVDISKLTPLFKGNVY